MAPPGWYRGAGHAYNCSAAASAAQQGGNAATIGLGGGGRCDAGALGLLDLLLAAQPVLAKRGGRASFGGASLLSSPSRVDTSGPGSLHTPSTHPRGAPEPRGVYAWSGGAMPNALQPVRPLKLCQSRRWPLLLTTPRPPTPRASSPSTCARRGPRPTWNGSCSCADRQAGRVRCSGVERREHCALRCRRGVAAVLHNPLLVDSAVFDAITLFSLCSSVYAVYPPIQPHTVCRNWYPVVNTYRTTVYTTTKIERPNTSSSFHRQ